MAVFVVHPWGGLFTGMLLGCWIGVVVGCAVTLLLMGRRIRQLETVNLLLRSKLKSREKPRRTGTGGPPIVMPMPGTARGASQPMSRTARSL
ncbi:MAG TPA: hypothetical protein VHX37_04340 [Acidobacteriaceae bacterium]|jgi:hypothetical protein|nr:hypothetical protein [Acidobacteriaceae bacterium]